jgi:hypothetical protein
MATGAQRPACFIERALDHVRQDVVLDNTARAVHAQIEIMALIVAPPKIA